MRTRTIRQKAAASPYEGPGNLPISKLKSDKDFTSKKRIVKNGRDYYVLTEGDRSFGSFETRSKAATRIRAIKKAMPKAVEPTASPVAKTEDTPPPTEPVTPAEVDCSLPAVLTFEACVAKTMPPAGESGLPQSLEQDVPPKYRYWEVDGPEDARLVRDALVEKQVFTAECIKSFRGEPRRIITRLVEKTSLPVYKSIVAPSIPVDVRPVLRAAAFLVDGDEDMVLIDKGIVAAFGVDEMVAKAKSLKSEWLFAAPDDPTHRIALKAIGGAYRMLTIPDVIFATSTAFAESAVIELVEPSREDEVITKALEGVTRLIVKSEEERIVYGVVLEPGTVDKQQDTISSGEIRQAAHKFMEDFGTLGLQHKESINGEAKLLETFIAPVDFDVNGDTITKGSWVMSERILNDELWTAVKKGEITGFSIGGSAIRKPI